MVQPLDSMSLRIAWITLVVLLTWVPSALAQFAVDSKAYEFRTPSRHGIGKWYMGREISKVMGHRGAAWLERRTRVTEEQPDAVVANLALKPDAVVADVGAGTGYFTFRLSRAVPRGRVLAVDVQPEMLGIIASRIQHSGITNVEPIRGSATNPHLPDAGVDLVLMVDAYHEFSHPLEMMRAIYRALRPGGRVVLVEYRGEDPSIPIKRLHKMTEAQVRKEMETVGLRCRETRDFLPRQHFLVFEKPSRRGSGS